MQESLSKYRTIDVSKDHIEDVLTKHIKEFRDPGWMNAIDSNLNPKEQWDTSKFKVLIVFLSSAEARAVASTDCVLNNLIKSKFGDAVFVDFCFMPDREDNPIYEKYNLPVIIGDVSWRAPQDYDLILISNSTVEEKINLPWMLHHSSIPIWFNQRIADSKLPLVLLGGNSSDMSDVFLGESEDGENYSLIDGAFIGYAEGQIDKIISIAMTGKEISCPKNQVLESMFVIPSFLHPEQFHYEYKENGWHIKSVTLAPDAEALGAKPYVEFNRPEDIDNYPGFERKILYPAADANHKSTDLQISWGCSSGGGCTFCKECHVSGGWREKSLEKLEQELIDARLWGMSDWVSWFSFNTNFYANYLKLMKLATQYFPKLTIIGMRADVIGARKDYFEFNKKIGQKRITFGIEGCSDRIRNGYLNKSLSEEELLKAFAVCYENRFLEVKMYLINTGLEEKEDFDEFVEFFRKTIRQRDEMGASTSYRIAITNLCYYPETPLQWERRRTIEQALQKERRFKYLIEALKGLGTKVRLGFTSRGIQFVYPQLVLDLGRRMTKILVKASIDNSILYYRNMSEDSIIWIMNEIRSKGYHINDIIAERPDDFIFPGSYVKTLNESYLKDSRDKLRAFTPKPYCLATPAKPDNRKCNACGYCTTKPMIEKRTLRTFDTETSVDEVLANVSLNMPRFKLLVLLNKLPQYDYLNPISVWKFLWARTMRELPRSEALKVYSLYECYERLIYRESCSDYTTGALLAEIKLKDKMDLDLIKTQYAKIQGEIKSIKLVDLRYMSLDAGIPYEAWQMIVINSINQDFALRDKVMQYDGAVKVIEKCMGDKNPKFSVKHMDIPELLFLEGSVTRGSYIIGSIPIHVNPYAFISSVTGENYLNTLARYKVSRIMYFREGMRTCQACGGVTYVNVYDEVQSSYCEKCIRKTIALKLRKQP